MVRLLEVVSPYGASDAWRPPPTPSAEPRGVKGRWARPGSFDEPQARSCLAENPGPAVREAEVRRGRALGSFSRLSSGFTSRLPAFSSAGAEINPLSGSAATWQKGPLIKRHLPGINAHAICVRGFATLDGTFASEIVGELVVLLLADFLVHAIQYDT